MTELYDGEFKVNKIAIVCMFKNNEKYLTDFFFDIVDEFEQTYHHTEFEYYVIENNSKDNTRSMLKEFFKKKNNSK
jgi:glycosyltransferase involved in cell wall biosynthesis